MGNFKLNLILLVFFIGSVPNSRPLGKLEVLRHLMIEYLQRSAAASWFDYTD